MDMRAVAAFKAGGPLSIATVQLDGPRDGAVPVDTGPAVIPPRQGRCS